MTDSDTRRVYLQMILFFCIGFFALVCVGWFIYQRALPKETMTTSQLFPGNNQELVPKLYGSDLLEKAESEGMVQVIVGFKVEGYPLNGATLTESELAVLEANVVAQRNALLDSLEGYEYQRTDEAWVIPYVSLEVDAQALKFLMDNPEVLTIEENQKSEPFHYKN